MQRLPFCIPLVVHYLFPVLDFSGKRTCGKDGKFVADTVATYPHMIVGVRRYFYHSQILGALVILSLQLYGVYQDAWVFSLIAVSPAFYLLLLVLSKVRRRRLSSSKAG